jgi:hypothetical protein
MSGIKKPAIVSKLVAPAPVPNSAKIVPITQITSPNKSALSPTNSAIKKPAIGSFSPAAAALSNAKSVLSAAQAALSSASTDTESESVASDDNSSISSYDSFPIEKNFSSMNDAERIHTLLPGSAGNQNVAVCVRLRPMNAMEKMTRQKNAWSVKDNIIFQSFVPETQAKTQPKPASYMYDHIFTEERNNEEIYQSIGEPILSNTMQGYHGCIFAYGQTSSGKTHTIHGTNDDPGMIPLAVEGIFDYIEAASDRVFTLRVSYLEIYNEIINDLLNPMGTNLQIREDKKLGIYCERLKEDIVVSPEQVFSLLSAGESHRHVGKTNYNEQSSRSHTIFRMVVESQAKNAGKNAPVRSSILNLVDLAGSENAVKAGDQSRVKETGFINRSLLTLGHVIAKLAERVVQHIPYRDSKLTRILQSSLSGKACIAVVCNLSPSSGNMEETISTLKFASRAKKMKSSAQVNEEFDQSALLVQYREEIDRLKTELERYKLMQRPQVISFTGDSGQESKTKGQEQAEEDEENQNALNAQIEQLTRMILTSGSGGGEEPNNPSSGTGNNGNNAGNEAVPFKFNPKVHSGTLRGKKNATLKSPYATLQRNASVEKSIAAAAAASKAHNLANSANNAAGKTADDPAVAHNAPGGNNSDGNSINCGEEATVAPPQPTISHSRRGSFTKFYQQSADYSHFGSEQLIQRIYELEAGNKLLHEAYQQSNKDLESWETYYVQVQNKNSALENRIKAISQSHSEKLQQAITRRTSMILPNPNQTGNLLNQNTSNTTAAASGNTPASIAGSQSKAPSAANTTATSAVQAPIAAAEVLVEEETILEEGKKLMDELNDLFDRYDTPLV